MSGATIEKEIPMGMGGVAVAAALGLATVGFVSSAGGSSAPPPVDPATGSTVSTINPVAEKIGGFFGDVAESAADAGGTAAGSGFESAANQIGNGTLIRGGATAVAVLGGIKAVGALGVGAGQGWRERIKAGPREPKPGPPQTTPPTTPEVTVPPATTPQTAPPVTATTPPTAPPVTSPPPTRPPVTTPATRAPQPASPPTSRPGSPVTRPGDTVTPGGIVLPPGVTMPPPVTLIPKPPVPTPGGGSSWPTTPPVSLTPPPMNAGALLLG